MDSRSAERPASVSFVCYFLIMAAGLKIALLLASLGNPVVQKKLEVPSQVVLPGITIAIGLLCAFFMLKGKNWARWSFYLLYGTCIVLLQIFNLALPSVISAVVFVLCGALLLSRRARCYFTGRDFHAELYRETTRKKARVEEPPQTGRYRY
jgi:hypothetical protein